MTQEKLPHRKELCLQSETVICEQAPNHGFYFAYAQLYFRKLSI